VLSRRFTSCFIDQVQVNFPKDGWAKITAAVKGTGKVDDNTCLELISAPDNAASLTLAANGVAGVSDTERLSNVQAVQVLNPATQSWDEVAYSAVSEAVPGVITISPPGAAATATTYRVYYLPQESGWTVFPARLDEPPLKVNQLEVTLGGRWDGSSFTGGTVLAAELRAITWTVKNYLNPESGPGAGTGYANRAFRYGREQTLKFDRDFRDFLMAQHLRDNDTIALHLKASGPEFAPGMNYQVELVFPRVAVLTAAVGLNQRRLKEDVQFTVLEDDNFGSVIAYVQNQVSGYAA
jgi:hypothetical protein